MLDTKRNKLLSDSSTYFIMVWVKDSHTHRIYNDCLCRRRNFFIKHFWRIILLYHFFLYLFIFPNVISFVMKDFGNIDLDLQRLWTLSYNDWEKEKKSLCIYIFHMEVKWF